MLDFINICTFVWATLWTTRAVVDIAKGDRRAILFVYLVYYVFFALPLGLDTVFGPPMYTIERGFRLATGDVTTSMLYCLYVGIVPVIWWYTGRRGAGTVKVQDLEVVGRRGRPLLYLAVVSPLLALLFAPEPGVYRVYGASVKGLISANVADYHSIVALTTIASIAGVAGLLLIRKRVTAASLFMFAPWLGLAVWLNGKRAIVSMAMLLLGYVAWHKGLIRGWRLPVFVTIAAIVLAGYSSVYQSSVRDGAFTSAQESYYSFRIDYGRDSVTKMAMFAELHPQMLQILEFRGQSVLFDATMMVPRSVWPDKPWPYAVYVTSAMLMMPPQNLGWGMTTSWLEEAIANFGWWGMLLAPLTIALICRLGDAQKSSFISILTVLVACLFMVVQLSAFAPVFLLWLVLVWRSHFVRPKRVTSVAPAANH